MALIHGSIIGDLGVEVGGDWEVDDLPNRVLGPLLVFTCIGAPFVVKFVGAHFVFNVFEMC